MMKFLTSLIALTLFMSVTARSTITVIDGDDRQAVPGVVVVSNRGIIIGITDNTGGIVAGDNEFPLSIRSMGYMPVTVDCHADTVVMSPISFELSGITVTPVDRPIMRVITFAREYTSATTSVDTMLTYNEYML